MSQCLSQQFCVECPSGVRLLASCVAALLHDMLPLDVTLHVGLESESSGADLAREAAIAPLR